MDQDTAHPASGSVVMRFSTRWLPERHRLDIWREEFGRRIVRLDVERLDDDPLLYDATFHALGEVSVGMGDVSAISCARTREMLEDGNGDIVLLIPEMDIVRLEQGRIDQTIGPGDCLVRRSSEVGRTLSRAGRFLTVNLPVDRLSERLTSVDLLGMTVVPADNPALHLLTAYCRALVAQAGGLSPSQCKMTGDHLLDLASLAIGANREAWHMAQGRGLRAARRLAAQGAIRRNAAQHDYRVGDLARDMRVSESYLRKLLAEGGHSFSALLLEARLCLAWDKLGDPRCDGLQISQIAFDCGFGDISYFNRSFSRRFEMTPSEARRQSRQGCKVDPDAPTPRPI